MNANTKFATGLKEYFASYKYCIVHTFMTPALSRDGDVPRIEFTLDFSESITGLEEAAQLV